MAPKKKKSFHTPRNTKNTEVSKSNEKNIIESNNEVFTAVTSDSNLYKGNEVNQRDKYSKRTIESNWNKYDDPVIDPHADSLRGRDFNVVLSYSGGSGSQLKFQDEKEWEDEYGKEISVDIPDLISAMKCIPFHERIGLQNVFDVKAIINFVEISEKHALLYNSQSKTPASEPKISEVPTEPNLTIIEETCFIEPDEVAPNNITVQDKTQNIIDSIASNYSNLSFKNTIDEKNEHITEPVEVNKPEPVPNDLDFLLSLNISSKISTKEESCNVSKSTNVDDWLNSILDD